MTNDQLFQIIYLLIEKGTLTAGELAEKLEVSVRTVYRAVDKLSAAGVPIYAAQGRKGGIQLVPGYVFDRSLLSQAEQKEIVFALQSMRALNADTGTALERLSSFFQHKESDWIEVDYSHWASGEQDRETFRKIKAGILEHRLLSFAYDSTSGERTLRKAEPMRLNFKGGAWYLQAYCLKRQEFRIFKIKRMGNVQLLDESFQPRVNPDKEIGEAGDNIHLKFRFTEKAAYRVRDEFDQAAVKVNADGSFETEVDFPYSDWVLGYALSFGAQAEVLEPEEIRRAVRREALAIANIYKET